MAPGSDNAGDLLAVYGTLMRGLAPAAAPDLGADVEFRGTCRIPGTLHDCGPYPALTAEPRLPGVVGELYRIVTPRLLDALDAYEGYDAEAPATSLFVRTRVRLLAPDVVAWVYHGGTANRIAPIPTGDWRTHLASRRV